MINREHFSDCSDNETFSFSLTCSSCGFVYKSTPIRYAASNKAQALSISKSELSLQQEKYSKAFDIANEEASKLFKSCKLCESTVCNDCVVWLADSFVCKQCKKSLITEVYNGSDTNELPRCIVFNRFVVPIFQNMNYFFDGERGKRIAFLEDKAKSFLISFEESMKCIDLSPESVYKEADSRHEYRNGSKYLHQRRMLQSNGNCSKGFIFFHMEFTDENGDRAILPGQMNVLDGYPQTDGVEPILKELLNSIELC